MEAGGHAKIIAVQFNPIRIKEQIQGLLAGRSSHESGVGHQMPELFRSATYALLLPFPALRHRPSGMRLMPGISDPGFGKCFTPAQDFSRCLDYVHGESRTCPFPWTHVQIRPSHMK